MGISLAFALGGVACSNSASDESCRNIAMDYGPEFRVTGVFSSTVGRLRDLQPGGSNEGLWPQVPAETPALLCYIDGPIPFSRPAPVGGLVPPTPISRAEVGLANNRVELLLAGPPENIAIRAP